MHCGKINGVRMAKKLPAFLDATILDSLPEEEKLNIVFLEDKVISQQARLAGMPLLRILREAGHDPHIAMDFRDVDEETLKQMDFHGLPMEHKVFSEKHIPVLLEKYEHGEITLNPMQKQEEIREVPSRARQKTNSFTERAMAEKRAEKDNSPRHRT
jgi:hypothetical protein